MLEKGMSLETWDDSKQEHIISEMLVLRKLQYLASQIGQEISGSNEVWPRMCNGFQSFWRHLSFLKKEAGTQVSTAIISSGHEGFIRKTFALYNLDLPDYIVTEDDIRGREFPDEITRRVKPGQLQMALAHRAWMKDLGKTGVGFSVEQARDLRNHICYFGDDPNKDGKFAHAAHVPFGLYAENEEWSISDNVNMFRFGSWKDVELRIASHVAMLNDRNRQTPEHFSQRGGVERQ
jgi:hypothetical protein